MFKNSIEEITSFLCAYQQGGNPLSDEDTSELYRILRKIESYQAKIDEIIEINEMRKLYRKKDLIEKLLKEHEEKENGEQTTKKSKKT